MEKLNFYTINLKYVELLEHAEFQITGANLSCLYQNQPRINHNGLAGHSLTAPAATPDKI